MISILSTLLMILLFFFSGKLVEGLKRLLTLIIEIFMRLLRLTGIKVCKRKKSLKLSDKFKATFRDIRVMRRSNQNLKMKRSINVFSLVIFVISILLIILNLESVSNNAISGWLFKHNPLPFFIITQQNMDITFTAISFSMLSFSSSTLYKQWKDTKDIRIAKKQIKQKRQLIDLMTSKEMLDLSRQKDKEKLKEILPPQEGKEVNV